MSGSVPVMLPQWRQFLHGYSDDYLRMADSEELGWLDEAQIENGWLGYEPASEGAVHAAEERLGIRLPPSYRNFLLASNGWRCIGPFVIELLKAEEIGWFAELHPDLWDISAEYDPDLAETLRGCLLLAGPGNPDFWLLDRNGAGPDGEWTAYSWDPGNGLPPQPQPSFGALVVDARELFERFRSEEGRPVHPDPYGTANLLAEGRRQALAGEAGAALASLQAANTKGSALAPYLAGLLMFFTNPGTPAEGYVRNFVLNERVLAAVDEVCLRAEMIPLYLNLWRDDATEKPGNLAERVAEYLPPAEPDTPPPSPDSSTGPAFDINTEAGIRVSPEVRVKFDTLAARAARYVPPVLPEAPAFQQALDDARGLIAVGDNDAAWEVIRQALPLWETDSPYRIAPVILLTDSTFRPVITPDRYRAIVTTPRRSAAR